MPVLTEKLAFLHLFHSSPKSLTLDTWKEWKKAKSVDIQDEIPSYLFGLWSQDYFISLAGRIVMDWWNIGCAPLSLIRGLSWEVEALSLDFLRLKQDLSLNLSLLAVSSQ